MRPRGFIQLSVMAWAAIAAGAVIVALGIGLKVQTSRLHAEQTAHMKFVADTKAVGDAQVKRNELEIALRNDLTDKREAEHATSIANITARYAAARLLNASPGSGPIQPLSSAAASLGCPDRQAVITRELERLESGVLALLERGDKAIERTVTCKAWLDDQVRQNKLLGAKP